MSVATANDKSWIVPCKRAKADNPEKPITEGEGLSVCRRETIPELGFVWVRPRSIVDDFVSFHSGGENEGNLFRAFQARSVRRDPVGRGTACGRPTSGLGPALQRCDPCEPCPTTPSTGVGQGGTSGQAENGGTAANPQGGAESGPAANLFAGQDVGAAGGAASAAPNMIGDFFAGATGTTFTYALNATSSASITTTAPPPGGAIPRFKMAEDTSPIPTDRVYLDYDYYHNVQLQQSDVQRECGHARLRKDVLRRHDVV